jgi:hypothetical protein
MKVTNLEEKCPYCGFNRCQSFLYKVCEVKIKTNVCYGCAKTFTIMIKEKEKDD